MTNCSNCKWYRLKESVQERKRLGVTIEEINRHCTECVSEFSLYCKSHNVTCFTCPWKDRNLPYEARKLHCNACVESFVAKGEHNCSKCPWNDPRRPMPTDAALAHCSACLAKVAGKSMNCETCAWRDTPKEVRSKHCAACSLRFVKNTKVVNSTNELSNKGQTIESYDNHNPGMADDRDTVTQIRGDYVQLRRSSSGTGSSHPVFEVAQRSGMTVEEFAQNAYEYTKRFLYEMSELTDLQALLFLSTIRGETKTLFAKRHGITDSAVNSLFKQVMFRSDIFKQYILLSRGTLQGQRGRKAKDPNAALKVPKKAKKITYSGMMQLNLSI